MSATLNSLKRTLIRSRPLPNRILAPLSSSSSRLHQSTSTSSSPSLTCPSCKTPLPPTSLNSPFCPNCSNLLPPAPPSTSSATHFDLFSLPAPSYQIDLKDLKRKFLMLQQKVHPDAHSGGGGGGDESSGVSGKDKERWAKEWSMRVNEAYRTLEGDLQRGEYLLSLSGLEVSESESLTNPELLMSIMETREALEEAETEEDVQKIREGNQEEVEETKALLLSAFNSSDHSTAKDLVIKLRYLGNVEQHLLLFQSRFSYHTVTLFPYSPHPLQPSPPLPPYAFHRPYQRKRVWSAQHLHLDTPRGEEFNWHIILAMQTTPYHHWGIELKPMGARMGDGTKELHHLNSKDYEEGERRYEVVLFGKGDRYRDEGDGKSWIFEEMGTFDGIWLEYVRSLLESFNYRVTKRCKFWTLAALYRLATLTSITGISHRKVDSVLNHHLRSTSDKVEWWAWVETHWMQIAVRGESRTWKSLTGKDWINEGRAPLEWVALDEEQGDIIREALLEDVVIIYKKKVEEVMLIEEERKEVVEEVPVSTVDNPLIPKARRRSWW